MNIIQNDYNNFLRNLIFNQFHDNLNKQLKKPNDKNEVFKYISLLSILDESLCSIANEFSIPNHSVANALKMQKMAFAI